MVLTCEYTRAYTLFRMAIGDFRDEQSFANVTGDPTFLSLLSRRDAGGLTTCYPDEVERVRFVKGILYAWATTRLAFTSRLGVYSRLFDRSKMFEDYVHEEMMTIVIIPVLRSIRDGAKHLADMPRPILLFADTAFRELDEFVVKEVDALEIFDETEFQREFHERLTQVNAGLAIKAVQCLSAAEIDRISRISETIDELRTKTVGLPEFESLKTEFRALCGRIEDNPVREHATNESDGIAQAVKTLEEEIARLREEVARAPAPQPAAPQPTGPRVLQPGMPGRVVQNLSRKQMRVLEKMFSDEDMD